MASSPSFYVEVLSTVYKRRSGEPEDLSPDEEESRQALAANGYRLLLSWKTPPGLTGETFDLEGFRSWYREAEPLLRDADRYEIGMSQLGHALVGVPADGEEWPPKPVRDLIEELQSDELDEGFRVQVLNSRGVTSRGLEEGGAQERELVRKYSEYADKFADRWPPRSCDFAGRSR